MLNFQIAISIILIAVPISVFCCKGCLDLDELSFNKIVKKFQYTLVKFDVAFPYGDKHEAYAELARELSTESNLLIATVGIKDYGEKDNNELGAKYGAKEPFPVIKLFKDGSVENPINFETDVDVTLQNLKNFLKKNTELYIGLAGCSEDFDKLAAEFIIKLPNPKTVQARGEALSKSLKAVDPQKHEMAKIYLMIMSKVEEKGEIFVTTEKKRVESLLKTKLSDKKKTELNYRLNILESFKRLPANEDKAEL